MFVVCSVAFCFKRVGVGLRLLLFIALVFVFLRVFIDCVFLLCFVCSIFAIDV